MGTKIRRTPQVAFVGSRALQYFLVVADLGNVSRAAVNLHVTQPALSRQIKRLEDQLGVAVLVRHGRGVRLTSAGEHLYEKAISLQRQFHQLCSELAENGGAARGPLTLAVTPTVAEMMVPELVARYRKLHPMVSLTIRQGYSDSVERMIEAGLADLGLFPTYGAFGPASPQLVTRPILAEREFLIGPGAPGRMRSRYRVRDLLKMPLIVPVRSNGLRLLLESLAAQHGLSLSIVAEADGMTLIKALVCKDLGYTILPLHMLKAELGSRALRGAEIVDPKLERVLVVAWHGARPMSHAARSIVPLISRLGEELVASGEWSNAVMKPTVEYDQ